MSGRGGAAGAKFRISLACPVGAVMNCADNTGHDYDQKDDDERDYEHDDVDENEEDVEGGEDYDDNDEVLALVVLS